MNATVAAVGGPRRVEVAVVIATYRRPDLLSRCLSALRVQTLEGDRFEVVVADDDAGNDGAAETKALVDASNDATDGAPRFRYVPVTRTQGPAGARNAGWRASSARIVAFTDDDTIPDPNWLAAGLAGLDNRYDAVGGAITMPLPARPTDYELDASGLSRAEFATANCFVHRAGLEAVDGFDERYTAAWREDSDLQFALLEAGFRVGHAPEAIVLHPVRPAPFGVSISQQRKVVFDALLFKKHRLLYRSRILPSPPWFYYLTVLVLLVGIVALASYRPTVALCAFASWVVLTLRFALVRLRGTSRRLTHIVEMLWTSIVIPPLALWWRMVGNVRYRVLFL